MLYHVSCQWIFKYRHDLNGNILKGKAFLIAQRFTLRYVSGI